MFIINENIDELLLTERFELIRMATKNQEPSSCVEILGKWNEETNHIQLRMTLLSEHPDVPGFLPCQSGEYDGRLLGVGSNNIVTSSTVSNQLRAGDSRSIGCVSSNEFLSSCFCEDQGGIFSRLTGQTNVRVETMACEQNDGSIVHGVR